VLSAIVVLNILIPITKIETESIPNMTVADVKTAIYGDDPTALANKCSR
jgi:hypothetical protein